MKTRDFILLSCSLVLAGFWSVASQKKADESAVDIMMKACESYANHKTVKIKALVSVDNFYDEHTKVQQNLVVEVAAKLPNKFKATAQGDALAGVFFDGSKVSVVDYKTNFYAQTEHPGNLDDFLTLTDRLNIPTPLLDFIVPANCKEALGKVTASEVLDELSMNGEPVTHLLFKNETDQIYWEAWVKKEGERSIVRKAVITSQYIASQPQYEFLLMTEVLNSEIPDSEFEFTPPKEAVHIEFLEDLSETGKEI